MISLHPRVFARSAASATALVRRLDALVVDGPVVVDESTSRGLVFQSPHRGDDHHYGRRPPPCASVTAHVQSPNRTLSRVDGLGVGRCESPTFHPGFSGFPHPPPPESRFWRGREAPDSPANGFEFVNPADPSTLSASI